MEIYGHLWLDNGDEVDLGGDEILRKSGGSKELMTPEQLAREVNPSNVISIGEFMLDDEANILVVDDNENEFIFYSIQQIYDVWDMLT